MLCPVSVPESLPVSAAGVFLVDVCADCLCILCFLCVVGAAELSVAAPAVSLPIAADELPDEVCANAPVAAVAVRRPVVMAINSLFLLMAKLLSRLRKLREAARVLKSAAT